jgi:hypothetical protein
LDVIFYNFCFFFHFISPILQEYAEARFSAYLQHKDNLLCLYGPRSGEMEP